MIASRLSHYDIVEEISRGGKGVVYRAVDVNLGRDVALKAKDRLSDARAGYKAALPGFDTELLRAPN